MGGPHGAIGLRQTSRLGTPASVYRCLLWIYFIDALFCRRGKFCVPRFFCRSFCSLSRFGFLQTGSGPIPVISTRISADILGGPFETVYAVAAAFQIMPLSHFSFPFTYFLWPLSPPPLTSCYLTTLPDCPSSMERNSIPRSTSTRPFFRNC